MLGLVQNSQLLEQKATYPSKSGFNFGCSLELDIDPSV